MNLKLTTTAVLLLTLLCLSSRPLLAQPATTPPPAPVDPSGLIIGVTAVDKPDATQMDATRNLRVWTFLYNNSPVTQVVDWRTRRLRSTKITADNSEHDYYGLFYIEPGEIVFMKSFFFFKTGFPGKFTFSVRDQAQKIYSMPAQPMSTNKGPFQALPESVQQRLIDAFLDQQDFKWWYRAY